MAFAIVEKGYYLGTSLVVKQTADLTADVNNIFIKEAKILSKMQHDNIVALLEVCDFLICDALRDLVPFAQFKNREKHPWRSVNLLKLTFLHGCFSRFLNCTNGTKSRNTPHISLMMELCEFYFEQFNVDKKVSFQISFCRI